jgi:superkiller protein 3
MSRWQRVAFAVVVAGLVAAPLLWWLRTSREPAAPSPPDVAVADPDVADAVARARAEVVARPKDASAWSQLGMTFLANGLVGPARPCFAEAGRLEPGDPRWPYLEGVSLQMSDPAAALPCWRRAAECPGEDARALTTRLRCAEALLTDGRPGEADGFLRAAATLNPGSPRVHFDLGLSAAARGRSDDAAGEFRHCLDEPAARRKACAHLAAILAAQGKGKEAAEFARRADGLPPDGDWPDPILSETVPFTVGRESLFLQAEKQQQQGNLRGAAELFDRVIRRYPDEGRAYAKLGLVLAEVGDYAAAENVLRAGLAQNPELVQGHYFLAVALFHQAERAGVLTPTSRDKMAGALAAATRATELKPDHGFAHLYRGLALKNLGRKEDALSALREAVRCTPEAADPHLHLGLALWDDGRAGEALKELETAARVAPATDKRPQAALDRVRKEAEKKS